MTDKGCSDPEKWRALARKLLKRRLYSYAYDITSDNEPKPHVIETAAWGVELFSDSGAYTMHTKGKPVSIEKYAEYIWKHGKLYSTVANIDAIGGGDDGAQRTWDNQKALEKLGVRPVPVFHCREPFKWLDRYLSEGYDRLALGGMVPESTPFLREWLDYVWGKHLTDADGRARLKVHGFGLTTIDLMRRYPWDSVDSSSWVLAGSFGGILLRNGDSLINVTMSDRPGAEGGDLFSEAGGKPPIRDKHYASLSKMERDEIDRRILACGVTPEECASHYAWRDIVNMTTYQGLEDLAVDRFWIPQQSMF